MQFRASETFGWFFTSGKTSSQTHFAKLGVVNILQKHQLVVNIIDFWALSSRIVLTAVTLQKETVSFLAVVSLDVSCLFRWFCSSVK